MVVAEMCIRDRVKTEPYSHNVGTCYRCHNDVEPLISAQWLSLIHISIETEEGAVTGVRGEKDTYPAEAVVLATGGVSYPATGSTGDGYRLSLIHI